MNICLGDILYRVKEDNNIEQLRVINVKSGNVYRLRNEENKVATFTKEEIEKYYTKLVPDGTISFAIVELEQKVKDVIVSLYRTKDMKAGDPVPHVVCRQSCYDFFTNPINNIPGLLFVGTSVRKDTIPDDTPFQVMLACNEIKYSLNVSYYITDSFQTTLSLFKHDKFDEVLRTLRNNVDTTNVRGYCQSLDQLLMENNFFFDILESFNIKMVPFEVELEGDDLLHNDVLMELEDVLKHKICNETTLPYTKMISIEEKMEELNCTKHLIYIDNLGKMYITFYNQGEYVNRSYSNLDTHEELYAMNKYNKIGLSI